MANRSAMRDKSARRSAPASARQPEQNPPAHANPVRRTMLIVAAILLAASLGVRLWYARHTPPPLSNDPQAIERRAREEPSSVAAQIDLGVLLRQQGRLDDANRAFAAASRIDPRDPRPYFGLALVAMAQQQPDRAASYYRQAVEHDPSDTASWRGLASVCELLRRQTDAIAAYE